MIDLNELARRLQPVKTVLFLGAGASSTSGAPLAGAVAGHLWKKLTGGATPPSSDDLTELSTILEMRHGRPALVGALRDLLAPLTPTGGVLSIPYHPWAAIYTTNYDKLVEQAYSRAKKSLTVVRSNYDYRHVDTTPNTNLFKLHGCISADVVDGSNARLVITERDYDEYAQYRQVLFSRLQLDLASRDVLIIGHSLRDPHIRSAVKQAAELKRAAGAPGTIFVLAFERDDDRAAVVEGYGVVVSFGGIDDLFALLKEPPVTGNAVATIAEAVSPLTAELLAAVVDVAHASNLPAAPDRLFAGSPASFADIQRGLTFPRSSEHRLLEALRGNKLSVTLTGVAGSGKTTLARRLLAVAHAAGSPAWELRFGMQLDARGWLEVASRLSDDGPPAFLLIDDCTSQQRQVNLLIDGLAGNAAPRLRLVLTAQTSQWEPRTKSPRLFSKGMVEGLSSLDDREIDSLLDLLDAQPDVRRLAGRDFLDKGRRQRAGTIRTRCSADMFVALKYLFSTDALDTILLREYAALAPELQDMYRLVAGLEAAGAKVHRQLVLRLLGIRADLLAGHLAVLTGLVDEFDISPDNGLYGLKTRHQVIAEVITRYKLADEDLQTRLLEDIIDALNPTLFIERSTVSAICLSEFGIGRVGTPSRRRALYERLIFVAPTERVPRHRLVRELLDGGQVAEAEIAIADAERSVGLDSPLRRYRVLLLIARATETEGLMREDRVALLAEARAAALKAIDMSPEDKYGYSAFVRVGEARHAVSGRLDYYDEAIEKMREGASIIMDPGLSKMLVDAEARRMPLKERST